MGTGMGYQFPAAADYAQIDKTSEALIEVVQNVGQAVGIFQSLQAVIMGDEIQH